MEHRVTKQLTRLGGCLYEKVAREGKESLVPDSEIRNLVEETKQLEADLARVEGTLESERKQKKTTQKRTKG